MRSSSPANSRGHCLRLLAGLALSLALALAVTACGQENSYVPPPPPKVTVQLPVQRTVTPYLEATGNEGLR